MHATINFNPNRTLPDPDVEPTVSVPRAAAILGIAPRTAYLAVASGAIPSYRFGRSLRIPTAELIERFKLRETMGKKTSTKTKS